jgi:hypothetical protein
MDRHEPAKRVHTDQKRRVFGLAERVAETSGGEFFYSLLLGAGDENTVEVLHEDEDRVQIKGLPVYNFLVGDRLQTHDSRRHLVVEVVLDPSFVRLVNDQFVAFGADEVPLDVHLAVLFLFSRDWLVEEVGGD